MGVTVTKPASKGLKALQYAENTLGVNSTYENLLGFRKKLDDALTELATLRDQKRDAEQAASDRELELVSEEHGRHPEMSVAAMERHLKLELPKDDELRDRRVGVSTTVSMIEGVEFDIRVIETDIRIAVARLTELGGYLNYLAAIKQTELAINTDKRKSGAE